MERSEKDNGPDGAWAGLQGSSGPAGEPTIQGFAPPPLSPLQPALTVRWRTLRAPSGSRILNAPQRSVSGLSPAPPQRPAIVSQGQPRCFSEERKAHGGSAESDIGERPSAWMAGCRRQLCRPGDGESNIEHKLSGTQSNVWRKDYFSFAGTESINSAVL